jgi:LysR family glycine cleavage system transcriptional activator
MKQVPGDSGPGANDPVHAHSGGANADFVGSRGSAVAAGDSSARGVSGPASGGSADRSAAPDRLPLASVRTFAVVARLSSISRAAAEMNVTPSAVSHQIKLLESYLDTRLFRREKNKLKLTPAGEQYVAQISEALLLLGVATKRLKAGKERQVLRVGCTPSLAYLWLIPRLEHFMKTHPGLEVTVTGVPDPPAVQHEAFDISFWYGSGSISGFTVEPLGANHNFPVCKPALAQGDHGLRSVADLARCTVIECSDETYHRYADSHDGWTRWLQAAGAHGLVPKHELNFTPRVLMHQAVVAGLGVGLSRTLLAVDALLRKDVVVPFGPALPTTATYNLVTLSHLARRKDVAAFREWVVSEANASAKKIQRLLDRIRSGSTRDLLNTS